MNEYIYNIYMVLLSLKGFEMAYPIKCKIASVYISSSNLFTILCHVYTGGTGNINCNNVSISFISTDD